MKLMKSPYLRSISDNSNEYTMNYHTLFGNPRIFNQEAMKFLDFFNEPVDIQDIETKVDGNINEIVENLKEIYFLISIGIDERTLLYNKREKHLQNVKERKTLDHIGLSVSEVCNFGCNHCIFFKHNKIKKDNRSSLIMGWETAKKCIDMYVSLLRDNGKTNGRIIFGNAEPLLNWNVIKKIFTYCEKIEDISFGYAMNTNLSLLTLDMAEMLKYYNVKIATSLDGLEEVNDLIRITKKGKGTFSIINKKIELLEKIKYPLEGISITVTPQNYKLIDTNIIDFAYNYGMNFIAFDYDLVNLLNIPVTDRVNNILRLKSYANKLGMIFGGTWYRPFGKLMNSSMLFETYAFCAAAEGRLIVFKPDGNIKLCGYTGTTVGNIDKFDDLFKEGSTFYQLIENRLPGTNPFCKGCVIEGFCSGQCYPTIESAKNCDLLLKDMCLFYKTMTESLINDYLTSYKDISFNVLDNKIGQLRLDSESKFKFSCSKGIKCSHGCCSNVNIILPPYDIIRIRKRLNLSSADFLEKYTIKKKLDKTMLPVVTLKMQDDDKKSCPFITSDGCLVYSDRPTICRYYPVIPKSRLESLETEEEFSFTRWVQCVGLRKTKEWTVKEWRDINEITLYDQENEDWKQLIKIIVLMNYSNKKMNSLKDELQRLFFMVSYDLDEFRQYVLQDSFLKHHHIRDDVINQIRIDDTELMHFGLNWLENLLRKEVI